MRTSYDSSARRLSSWLMVVLGLAAYVGLLYGLTLVPLQLEVPLPSWGVAVAPPIAYGLLVLLMVRWPTPLGWLIGTAVLSGLHTALTFARAPISAFLDPTLAGRPLPWVVPPPLPELIGLVLLLVPLRDLLRARRPSARERLAAARAAGATRVRGTGRPVQPAPVDDRITASEGPTPARVEVAPEPTPAVPVAPAAPAPAPVTTTVSAVDIESGDEIRRRRAAARAERRRDMEARRPAPRQSDAVIRIALNRIMDQLPPGTFLAPEDEVAANLRQPGYLLIPGDLVVTQLSEGVARVAWNDIVDQFPAHLIGLSRDEITEHLAEGLRLPLDEVVSQLPQDLFVADRPEVEVPGLDRIPVPFHPVDDAAPAAPPVPAAAPIPSAPPVPPGPSAGPSAPDVVPARIASQVAPAARPSLARPTPAPIAPEPPSYVDEPSVPAPAVSIEAAAAAPITAAAPVVPPPTIHPVPGPTSAAEAASNPAPEFREATVQISLARLEAEIPAEAFREPWAQVSARMHAPGVLLVPLSKVLPQLGEGLVRVGWEVVAPQFPHDLMIISDAEMASRLPHGLQLPLDEVVRQLSADLFANTGPAADVSGLESFPAPFQPLVSDPSPEAVSAATSAPVASPVTPAEPPPSPLLGSPASPVAVDADVAAEPGPSVEVPESTPIAEPLAVETFARVDYREPETVKSSEAAGDVISHDEASQSQVKAAESHDGQSAVEASAPARPELVPTEEPTVLPEPVVTPAAAGTEPAPIVHGAAGVSVDPSEPRPVGRWNDSEPRSATPPLAATSPAEPRHRWDDVTVPSEPGPLAHGLDPESSSRLRQIAGLLTRVAPFEATVQSMEGVKVYAFVAPAVSGELAGAATGLALPLLTEGRAPWAIDQLTLRGAETALVLTPLGPARGPVLAAAVRRGGALALLEMLCRRAVDGDRGASVSSASAGCDRAGTLVATAVSPAASAHASSLTAFGAVTASVLRDTEGETTFFFFLPSGVDVPAVGAFAQDLQAVMRKAAGSGAVFRSAVVRSGRTIVVIQPEEVGHGRSIVVVAGGDVTRPGLAYRQVERAIATLAQA
ncbi:MAG TPA: hypothetical protein VFE48_18580 [Methylomirabilota bacterium]|nr:hypothetical protein [Methylomirabilota bacterium]